tara:strand:- start:44229 stop:44414 length:186 start_codon:yes stop_codon:yes gene_type:complete
MEILLFTLNAVVIYLVSDWVIRQIEARRGSILPQRQIAFFIIFLSLALISFRILQTLLSSS